MNTDIINALRKYVDDYTNVYSFNGLVVKAAQKYLGETGFTSFNDLVRRAANKYTGGSRLSVNDAVRDALVQYTGSSSFSVDDLVNIAAIKYLTAEPGPDPEPAPPTNTVAPVVSGTPSVGQTLASTNGVWTNSPTGYTYQWKRNGSNISGATNSTYLLVTADVGATITITVVATNADGSASATSNGVGPIAALPAKTYADFVAHIATLAPSSRTWETNASISGLFRTTANTNSLAAAGMNGSSWNSVYDNGSAPARIAQHAFKDQPTWEAQRTAGLEMVMQTTAAGVADVVSVLRNGYSSGSATGATGRTCTRLIRWDQTLSKAFESNPSIGGAETEYTW